MAFVHGKAGAFKIGTVATPGTVVDISAYLDNISFPESVETGETTVFGQASKTYVVGLKDSTVSISGKWDSVVDTQLFALLGNATAVTWEYGPAGSTVGLVRYTGTGFVTSYEVTTPVADVVTFSAELQVTGNVTRNTF